MNPAYSRKQSAYHATKGDQDCYCELLDQLQTVYKKITQPGETNKFYWEWCRHSGVE